MQKQTSSPNAVFLAASDLVNFLACEHLTALDLKALNPESNLQKVGADESTKLIQDKGFAHEKRYLQQLVEIERDVVDLSQLKGSLDAKLKATVNAMKEGKAVIFQAALQHDQFIGYADFLIRVDKPSQLGKFSYEVIDTKLARSPKAKFFIQLCFYSDLIAQIQGILPEKMHLVLGGQEHDRLKPQDYRVADYIHYYRTVMTTFIDFIDSGAKNTYPETCEHCDLCHWRDRCQNQWLTDDHLNQVANIRKNQIRNLKNADITTLEALANLPSNQAIPRVQGGTLLKLRTQAQLQQYKKSKGENKFELLPDDANKMSGLYRLPVPDIGDLFFDMEGNPFESGGLEYLFGVYYFDNKEAQFKAFWAHDRQEERKAFEDFMDFVRERLKIYPNAHIYHYNHYEVTALKRLMSVHGTRENDMDNLLRRQKFVDLYKVVREAMQTSEPGYSIKNLETFYMPDDPRQGDVKNAGASIVYYENWRIEENKDKKADILESIRAYNEYDCRSTYELRQWLIEKRPDAMPWFSIQEKKEEDKDNASQPNEWELRLEKYRTDLVGQLPQDKTTWTAKQHLRELLYFLLDFHRRCDKPAWWKIFERQEHFWSGNREALFEDVECIVDMELLSSKPVDRSNLYTYRYPEQEIKFSKGDACIRVDSLEGVNSIESLDEEKRSVKLKVGNTKKLPKLLTISKSGPIQTSVLKDALLRFADSYIKEENRYQAIQALLSKELPKIQNHQLGLPIISNETEVTQQVIDAINNLQNSYLFIQGPPGAGKTYTGSHVIVDLLKRGKKVGVSSLSHKAINNLLAAVDTLAQEQNIAFQGIKKSDNNRPETHFNGKFIGNIFDNKIDIANSNLIAGTAYLFARPEFDQQLDYLFVDEAGQISLANLVAMATSACNIVLMGDQMQLGQPIQGTHPGESGKSALEYLLGDEATIAPESGVFLATTWRMHEDVCRFISEAVYDGKLHPEPHNQKQRLILQPNAHKTLKTTGIGFLPVEHAGCSQRSEKEAILVKDIYQNLLQQSYQDKNGNKHPMTADDILVLSPYNMQVNLLKRILPEDARVGTVDKFQGQEAQVVIISMATSSGEELPRDIEFLYSKNRLNVSISRAKCLALLVASPALMAVKCNTIEQIALVNTLCQLQDYSVIN